MKNLIVGLMLFSSCVYVSSNNKVSKKETPTLPGYTCKDSDADLGPDWDTVYLCEWDGGSGFVGIQRFYRQPENDLQDAGVNWPVGDYPGAENECLVDKG